MMMTKPVIVNSLILKKQARKLLKGHWLWFCVVLLGITAVSTLFVPFRDKTDLKSLYLSALISCLVGGFLGLSFLRATVVYQNDPGNSVFDIEQNSFWRNFNNMIENMFGIFFNNQELLGQLLSYLLRFIFELGWSLLLFIPGIIKSYSYALTPYLVTDLVEHYGSLAKPTEAINISKELMAGHKWDLFKLDLSFVGWFIVGILTFGIGLIWIEPYYVMARTCFYKAVLGNYFESKKQVKE